MPQYGFIPLVNAPQFGDVTQYPVRIAAYMPGVAPDITDQDGNPIPNILQTEAYETYTQAQAQAHVNCGGQIFDNNEAYQSYLTEQYASTQG